MNKLVNESPQFSLRTHQPKDAAFTLLTMLVIEQGKLIIRINFPTANYQEAACNHQTV